MHTYTSPPRSARKARELLTTSGGAPKPEPELRVRVAQQARALGDLAGSIVCMWIVEVLGANPHELRDLRYAVVNWNTNLCKFMQMNAS